MWKTATYIGEKFVCRSAKKNFTGAICDCLLCVGTALKTEGTEEEGKKRKRKEKRERKKEKRTEISVGVRDYFN